MTQNGEHSTWLRSGTIVAALGLAACGGDDAVAIDAAVRIDAPPAIDAAAIDAPLAIDAPPVAVRSIQELQDGTVPTGAAATIDKVFVTALRITPPGNLLAFVQEPDGVTTGGHTYPQYAGVQLFISTAEVAQFPGVEAIQIGDCITLTGNTLEFQDDTELVTPTAFTLEPAGSCGTAPTPLVIPTGALTFDALATDTDDVTAGDQPGASAEIYEGVLMRVTNVTAPAATDGTTGEFRVVKTAGGAGSLAIRAFVYPNAGPVPATAGQAFASITGVYAQRMNFQLLPRTAADLQ